MTIQRKDRERVVMLAALAIIQAGLVIEFCVHRHSIESFIVLSVILTLLFATLYWIGWLVRHGVTNFEVCMVIGVGALAMNFWHDGDRVLSIAVACAGLFFAMALLRRLLRPIDIDQQEANLKAYRAEATRVSPARRHASALVAYAILGGVVWIANHFEFPRYGYFLFVLALSDAIMLIYHMVKNKRTSTPVKSSVEDATVQGGRA